MRTEEEIRHALSEMEDMRTLVAYSYVNQIAVLKWVLGEDTVKHP
jgi:hypothetical protein